MASSIVFIFWGLLFIFFGIGINQFDLLLDLAGYILVSIGAGGLIRTSDQFDTTRFSCWLLVALSFAAIFFQKRWEGLLGLIHLVIQCNIIWFLLGGFMDLSYSSYRSDLAEKASKRRIAYIVIMSIAILMSLLPISDILGMLAILVAAPLLIAMYILFVMILHLTLQVKSIFAQHANDLVKDSV